MSPKKVRPHLSEDIKNRIAGLRQSNLSYKQIFDIFEKRKCKNFSLCCEENWSKVRNRRLSEKEVWIWPPKSLNC